MSRPVLLDLFCGAGGASLGYYKAGFDVLGVDHIFMRRYPFEFFEGDALEFLAKHGNEFDAIHASPPCHYASAATRGRDWKAYPNLLPATRSALQQLDVPWVIENVEGAAMINPVWLCGTEFGLTTNDVDGTPLELWRHRGFESNIPLVGGGGCKHHKYAKIVAGVYAGGNRRRERAVGSGYVPNKATQSALMGITWMSERELHQAIPPAYSEHIGKQLIEAMATAAA